MTRFAARTSVELTTRLLGDDPAFRRRVHGIAVDEWLRLGAVRPSFRWDGDRAHVKNLKRVICELEEIANPARVFAR